MPDVTPLILDAQPTMAGPSVVVLSVLMLLLATSTGAFWALVWQATSARRRAALDEWARASGFYHNPLARLRPPHPLELFGRRVRVRDCYISTRGTVVEFLADRRPPGADEAAAIAGAADTDTAAPAPPAVRRWHALVWPAPDGREWPTVGLRPAAAADSLVDLLPDPARPPHSATPRFVVHSGDRPTAAAVAASSLGGLLPPDVGLILTGRHLVLDFSGRPFDGIEFNRMIAVAEQMAKHLPIG